MQQIAELVKDSGWNSSRGSDSLRDHKAAEIVEEVHKAVVAYAEGAPAADDITVVIARRL